MLTSDQKGSVAEVAVAWAAVKAAIGVFKPLTDGKRYDLIHRRYSREEIDLVAAYCADTDRCYVVPPALFDGRAAAQLRLSPTRNNQALRANWRAITSSRG